MFSARNFLHLLLLCTVSVISFFIGARQQNSITNTISIIKEGKEDIKSKERIRNNSKEHSTYHVPKLIGGYGNYNETLTSLIRKKRQSFHRIVPDCFCPKGRPNYIFYTDCPQGKNHANLGAGIKDRMNILRHLMWYADELCAKIFLSCTPKIWLSEAHGCFAPQYASWTDYFTPMRNVSGSVSKADIILSADEVENAQFDTMDIIVSDHGPSIYEYEIARKRIQNKSKPFIWVFDKNFWSTDLYTPRFGWPKQNLNHRTYTEDCSMVDFDTSEELLLIGQLLLDSLGLERSEDYATLHLRKKDWNKCDTSPSVVVDYLKCSLQGQHIKSLIVMTNGSNGYFNHLRKEFQIAFPKIRIVPLDRKIGSESFLEELDTEGLLKSHTMEQFKEDNCFKFSAEKVLMEFASFHLERGHNHCRKCDRGGSFSYGAMI